MKIKKAVILGVICLAVLAFAQVNVAFAEDGVGESAGSAGAGSQSSLPSGSTSDAIKDTFNVRDYLNIGKKPEDKARFGENVQQGESYFDRAQEMSEQTGQTVSPVAAFIVTVIDFLVAVIGSVSLLVFIVGALLTIVSEGQEDRLAKGKQAMIYSLIGLALALAAYLIATFVQSIFY